MSFIAAIKKLQAEFKAVFLVAAPENFSELVQSGVVSPHRQHAGKSYAIFCSLGVFIRTISRIQ